MVNLTYFWAAIEKWNYTTTQRLISKPLNTVECAEDDLPETLEVRYELTDDPISNRIREHDSLVQEVVRMVVGISQKLPQTYNVVMKSKK